jgi:DNA helicase II / ATP-dependent DNA helicase PcrA
VPRDYAIQPFHPPSATRVDYARELNEQQLAAVCAPPGASLVLAGAGAGKTRTLTYRVAWLVEHGVAPERILLLTFTNKAAREMMERVQDLLGSDAGGLWGGTFHSVGMRILRRFSERIGYRSGFTVADREDAKELLSACIADAGIDPKKTRFPKPEALADIFSLATNTRRTIADLVAADYEEFEPLTDQIRNIAARYAARKKASGVMDFDDLLSLWLGLLSGDEEAREWHHRRFQFVLVDEYQDTNSLQGDLLDAITGAGGSLMAVGDDAQSIYSWRGANFANILDFPKRRAGAQVYRIEVNYRSTPQILNVANAVIARNERQFPKELRAARPPGLKPVLAVATDAREQAAFIAQRSLELRDEGRALSGICVLYRSHFHALELQLELTRRNIPFAITSGIRFFEQAHIKDVAAYLKLLVNPDDELSFKRLARMLPGVGGAAASKLWTAFEARLRVLETHSKETRKEPLVAASLAAAASSAPKKCAADWAQFTATMAQAAAPDVMASPERLIRLLLDAVYADYLKASYDDAKRRLEDLEQLAGYARQFTEVAELLSQLALQTNVEAEHMGAPGDDEERIRLSTVHQAKGLEFDVVFVVMLCEGLFPSSWSVTTQDGEEEERRLFYVAATRAQNELYLCHPLTRFLPGGGGGFQTPSRFIGEIPRELLDEWNLRPAWGAPRGGFQGFGGETDTSGARNHGDAEAGPAPDSDDEPF